MQAKAYYNEFDPKAAAWLRELIKKGLIADGEVDERSITDVQANDLVGFRQCHFFAGIGGWSYALRLAGIPDEYQVWTGSCPCQPFSQAGKNKGKADERHLLPIFTKLIGEVRPVTVFGEQVEGAIKHGWLDDLQADLEREDYTIGATVLGAHSVGSFHQRQRLYWVAHSNDKGLERRERAERTNQQFVRENSLVDGMAHADSERYNRKYPLLQREERGWYTKNSMETPWGSEINWIECRDGKQRPIKSGIEPLANGIPKGMGYSGDPDNTGLARVMRLRGYGNAIVPQTAALFIESFFEVMNAN